jgi:excisionase family DNA binding protein
MDVITIESKAYQEIVGKIDRVFDIVHAAHADPHDKYVEKQWLNTEEACNMLNISYRTLLRMKSRGQIKFSIFKRSYVYQRSDVIRIIDENILNEPLS